MDPSFHLENQSMDEFFDWELDNGPMFETTYPDQKLACGQSLPEQSIGGVQVHSLQSHPFPNGVVSSTSFVDTDDDNRNDRDLSDGVLRYIDQILMEDDMEDNTQLQESLDFQAKARSFYEVLGEKYPPSPQQESTLNCQYGEERPDDNYVDHHNFMTSSRDDSGYLIDVVDRSCLNTRTDDDAYCTNYIASNSTNISSSNSLNSVIHQSNTPTSPPQTGDMYSVSEVVRSFMKGVNDASKFLPSGSKLLDMNSLLVQNPNNGGKSVDKDDETHFETRGKKNQHSEDINCKEERSNKLPAVDTEAKVRTEEFDDVWNYTLSEREELLASYMAELQISEGESVQQVKGSCKAKGRRGKKKKEVIDLTSLLTNCAQSVSAGDSHKASELLKQIRLHSSPFGNCRQKIAHYFADGLEARLAGAGSDIYNALVHKRKTAAEYLKAYCLSIISSPSRKISNFALNKTIMIKSEKATRIHIIDFGIFYGFQWPVFIQRVADREGGLQKLRITGVDYPQLGSQPAERIEETGLRLAYYAEMFNVPFEYNAIAQNWDTIKIEDLKIEEGEFLAVTCSFRAKNLVSETAIAETSRNTFLDLIREMNPDIFIHGTVNGSYDSPYFVSRFRKALSHFSAKFDMMEEMFPGYKSERMVIERDVLGKEVLNIVACEGVDRIERACAYTQWQVHHLRVGFMQVPFDGKLMDTIMYKVRSFYHRDFVVVECNKWLFMTWKGQIFYAISCWVPSTT